MMWERIVLGLFEQKWGQSLHDLDSNVLIKEVEVWDFFRMKGPGTRPLHVHWYMIQEGKMEVVVSTRGKLVR